MKIPKNSPLLKTVVLREVSKGSCPYNRAGQNLRGKGRYWCGKLDELVGQPASIKLAQSYRPCGFSDYLSCELCWGYRVSWRH